MKISRRSILTISPRDDGVNIADIELKKEITNQCMGLAEDSAKYWNWAMERIGYYKENGTDRNALYTFEANLIRLSLDGYFNNFVRFRKAVDDATPIIMVCQDLLKLGEVKYAKYVAEPYVRYIESKADEIVGKQVCCQNIREEYIMINDFFSLQTKPRTPNNYTYLLVLYCTILDAIPIETAKEMNERKVVKNRILSIAKEISPWCSVVYEGLSWTVDDEDEYLDYITKALKYTTQDGEPYGLGQVYENLAMHYALKNDELAQALCFMSKKHGGNPIAVNYVLSKTGSAQKEFTSERKAAKVLKAANIQVGFSPLVKKMRRAGIK